MDGEVWHLVEGRRDDGAPAIFRIRELAPRVDLPRIFVVEMPYPITEMSKLPNASAYRRLAQFEEQWVVPACAATGYELVGLKIEEGSFFLYMYGAADPGEVIQRLAPFDAALGFYDDEDPSWVEYSTLKDLLDQAKAMPAESERTADPEPEPELEPPVVRARAATITGIPPGPRPASPAQPQVAAKKTTTRIAKPKSAAPPKQKTAAKKPAAKKPAAKARANKSAAKKRMKSSGARKPAAAKKSGAKPAKKKPAVKKRR